MAARASRTLILMAVMLVAAVYVTDYLRAGGPKHAAGGERYVIQSGVSKFSSELLLERQPIVVHDRVLAVRPFAAETLRYQYVYMRDRGDTRITSSDSRPVDTIARATFVSPKRRPSPSSPSGAHDRNDDPDHVMLVARPLYGAASKDDIVFKLRFSQVLVLPPHWQVSCVTRSRVEGDTGGKDEQEEEEVDVNIVEAFDAVSLAVCPFLRLLSPYGRGTMPVLTPDSSDLDSVSDV